MLHSLSLAHPHVACSPRAVSGSPASRISFWSDRWVQCQALRWPPMAEERGMALCPQACRSSLALVFY